jgi:hypothetical protein
MDVERIIEDIEQLEEMFEAPDIRPLSASEISVANRRHDDMLAHSPWFRLWLQASDRREWVRWTGAKLPSQQWRAADGSVMSPENEDSTEQQPNQRPAGTADVHECDCEFLW